MTIIIGSGISGLFAAQTLARAGKAVTVLDKGRGPGGRVASRAMDNGARIDFGAQFFTIRDDRFAGWAREWQKKGVIKPWPEKIKNLDGPDDDSEDKFIAPGGLRDVAKEMALGLNVKQQVEVSRIMPLASGWQVESAAGEVFEANQIILTAPLPQALQLLKGARLNIPHHLYKPFAAVNYDPCLTLMIEGHVNDGPPFFTLDNHPVQLLVDNGAKGLAEGQRAITINTSADFSRQAWEWESVRIVGFIEQALEPYCRLNIDRAHVHRWRYARVHNPFQKAFADLEQKNPLLLAGDAFGGPRIELAALSGISAARHLLEKA